jgi:hypothetical protein
MAAETGAVTSSDIEIVERERKNVNILMGLMRFSPLIGLSLFIVGQAWGCVCAAWPSAKDAWADSPVVFLGSVERTDPGGDFEELVGRQQSVWVRVDEPFKGAQKDQTFELKQGNNDCAPKFKTGERVVFYLDRREKSGVWVAPGCGRTRTLESAADDLLFLRKLPASAKRSRLSGEVEVYENAVPDGFRRIGVLPGVKVAAAKEGGAPLDAFTNADGVYELYDLPPGKYKVTIEVPKGLRIDFPVRTGLRNLDFSDTTVEIKSDSGVSIGFVLMADTKITGRVIDPEGKPMEGVCLDALPSSGTTAGPSRIFDCTKSDGTYTMEMMSPGQYQIVANREGMVTAREPFRTVYYPGTSDPKKAGLITVTAGSVVEGIDLRILSVEKLFKLSGVVQFDDGNPLAKAWIIYTDSSGKERQRKSATADGSFSFSEVVGEGGAVHAEIMVSRDLASDCPQFSAAFRPNAFVTFLKTPVLAISGESDEPNLVLVLPMKSCKAWPPQWLK